MASSLQQVSRVFRERTGVGLAAVLPLFFVGALSIVLSAPTLVTIQESDGWPARPQQMWIWLGDRLNNYKIWSHSASVQTVGRELLGAGIVLILIVPIAALIRTVRLRRLEPLATTMYSLSLGIVSFPVVLWTIRVVEFVYDASVIILIAINRFIGFIEPAMAVIALVLLIGAALLGLYVGVESLRDVSLGRKALLIAIALALAALVVLAVWAFAPGFIQTLVNALAPVGHAIAWLLRLVLLILEVVVLALLAAGAIAVLLLVVAQVGSVYCLPLFSAGLAGREQSACADFAAGTGVSFSVLLTIATVVGKFRHEFTAAVNESPFHQVLGWLPTSFGGLIPNHYFAQLHRTLRGASGLPETSLLVLTCLIGIFSLVFSSRTRDANGGGSLTRLALLKTGAAFLVIVPALLISYWAGS